MERTNLLKRHPHASHAPPEITACKPKLRERPRKLLVLTVSSVQLKQLISEDIHVKSEHTDKQVANSKNLTTVHRAPKNIIAPKRE